MLKHIVGEVGNGVTQPNRDEKNSENEGTHSMNHILYWLLVDNIFVVIVSIYITSILQITYLIYMCLLISKKMSSRLFFYINFNIINILFTI